MKLRFFNKKGKDLTNNTVKPSEQRGSAIVIALLIMVLLLGFVALAVSRTSNETVATSNDAAESRAFEAAQASLEVMTRNFDKIFEVKLNPDTADLNNIKSQNPPGFTANYDFEQNIIPTQTPQQTILESGDYEGLLATQDEWQLTTTAEDKTNGVQVALRRRFYNNRIPIFQFGIFYDDDLEFHPGPRFDFGGRVHSNGNIFLMAQTGLYFSSKVDATKQIVTDVARNSAPWTDWDDNVFIKNASGSYVKLAHDMGSVLQSPVNGSPFFANADMPTVYKNDNWDTNEKLFEGNLLANQKPLELPIRIASSISLKPLDYVELIKRGKSVGDLYNDGTGVLNPSIVPVTAGVADTDITKKERYYNKTGIRVSLADTQNRLPGCAAVAAGGSCGIQLAGTGATPSTGYKPMPMTGYQATEINGERFAAGGHQVWIKIEAVGINPVTNIPEDPRDITEDILSLGVTEPAPFETNFQITDSGYGDCGTDTNADCRSVIKLQRFNIEGPAIVSLSDPFMTSKPASASNYYNFIVSDSANTTLIPTNNGFTTDSAHKKTVTFTEGATSTQIKIVPFPINMFDTREGLYREGINIGTTYPGGTIPWSGVMSMVDIDIANLRKFLSGTWDGKFPATTLFPAGLRSTDIPSANGWVLYISDRRGDYDFDGEYDMEDIYGDNDNVLQPGEDVDTNGSDLGTLQAEYTNEAVKYRDYVQPSEAATLEHKYYRRGIRLINGEKLPGIYDAANPANTRGFTVASENGVYVKGNYNAYGVAAYDDPTPSTDYLPQDNADHIPASIAADAVTILSRAWNDAESFKYPFSLGNRNASETFVRFAMLSGDTKSSKNASPNQGGGNPRMNGGVHNFKRFLEDWGGVRLNYAGSLINLYNSRNNNGAFKCCSVIYSPPTRNWVFDTSFLDPNRLPPGTPFFQTIQLTGFERLN